MSGDATSFFERRYREGRTPWDDGAPNDLLEAWLGDRPARGSAIVVGCGLGDDAALLAGRGWTTTGFDFAPTGIAGARHRRADGVGLSVVSQLGIAEPSFWAGLILIVVFVFDSISSALRRRLMGGGS